MKILVTGYSALQRASTRRPIQKIDVPALMVDELRKQGHDVFWGPWNLGNDPRDSGFQAQLICMNQLCSVTAYAALDALWLLGVGMPTVLFWDDWQTRACHSHHRSFFRGGDIQIDKRWTSGSRFYTTVPESLLTRKMRDKLIDIAWHVGESEPMPEWRANLYPRYRWGTDTRLLTQQGIRNLPHLAVDSSAKIELVDRDLICAPRDRKREWILASVAPHDKWVEKKVEPTWKVRYYGSRKLARESGAERLKTELDVQIEMSKRWGSLAPEYPGVAAGWWRSRFLYSAHLRTILVGDARSSRVLGSAHAITAREVEKLSDRQLIKLAQEQADAFLPRIGTHETFSEEMRSLVKAFK
jgi:hypothetical protein